MFIGFFVCVLGEGTWVFRRVFRLFVYEYFLVYSVVLGRGFRFFLIFSSFFVIL